MLVRSAEISGHKVRAMITGVICLLIEIIALIGCLWAKVPFKKALLILLWAPIVVFGSLFMFIAGISCATMLLGLILEYFGLDTTPYLTHIAVALGISIVAVLVWAYFSNEREINLRDKRFK